MAKQKFQCKGVLRKTGKRVAVEVSAETKEAALQIADKHGVTVDEIVPAQAQPQSQSAPRPKPAVARANNLDRQPDGLLDPQSLAFGLSDELGETPQAGEPVLAPVSMGRGSRSKSRRPWIILGGAAVAVLLVLIAAITLWPSAPSSSPVAASKPTPPPEKKQEIPKPTKPKPKHSEEELAYAAKLPPLLDACDKMIRLLQGPLAPEQCAKQTNAIRDLFAKMPSPPSDAAWTAQAAAAVKQLVDEAETATTAQRSGNETLGLVGGMSGDSPEAKEASRKAAANMRTLVDRIRGLIPPECLPKS